MKLHKAIKKMKEGYRIQSEVMVEAGEGYVFFQNDQMWFTTENLKVQTTYFITHEDFDLEWYLA